MLRRGFIVSLFLVCPLVASAVAPVAQLTIQPTSITDDPLCKECALVRTERVRLGTKRSPGLVGLDAIAAIDGAGQYFVTDYDKARVHVFGADGSYRTTFGVRGQGPGEAEVVTAIVTPGDGNVYVYGLPPRVGIYAEATFAHTRTLGLELPPGIGATLRWADGSTLVSHKGRDGSLAGYSLHKLTATGQRDVSFGAEDSEFHPFVPGLRTARRLAWATDTTFWAGNADTYRIDQWGVDGTHVAAVQRVAPWFPTAWASRAEFDGPTPPILATLVADGPDRLWTAVLMRDDGWRDQIASYSEINEPMFEGSDNALWDTVIEIIDLTENRVIASQRFDEYITAFLAPGVIGAVMDEGMETYYQVWDLSVDR